MAVNHLMASRKLKHSGQRLMINTKSEMKYYNILIHMNGVFHDTKSDLERLI